MCLYRLCEECRFPKKKPNPPSHTEVYFPAVMKNKHHFVRPAARSASALPLALTLALVGSSAHAATIYWDNVGGTANSWADVANWSTVVGGGTNPGAIPGSADVATFSATGIQTTAQTVNLNANQSVAGLDVLAGVTANTTLASGGVASRTLTIGASGITNAGSGVVTIGTPTADPLKVNVVFAGSQSIANNGSANIIFNNNVTGTGSPTITNNGTGSGQVIFGGNGAININVSRFVQDSATSSLRLRNLGSNTFSGGVEIKKGTLNFGNKSSNLGTGMVTLGNGAGGTDAATLDVEDSSNQSFANAIELAPATTGTLTFRLSEGSTSVSHSKTFTGGVTGSNSLTIENNGGTGAAADTLNFTTGAINNAGTLTHIGTGAGLTTISSVIGSNVTGLTQNSSTSTLVLGGANLYSGSTTVSSGALRLANQNAVQNSTVTMGGGTGAALTFASSVGGNAFTLGGLAASAAGAGYNISLLNNAGSPAPIALTVGGNNSSTTYAGVLSGGGSLIKAGSGALTLSGTNTYTGATTVAAGQLTVNGSNSSSSLTTVQSGATLGGSGTVGALALQSDGTISPGNSPGTLSVIGTTTWAGGGNYNWQLLDATGTAGSGWDTVSITGALDLTNLTLGSPFKVNLWSLSTFAGSGGNALNFNSSLSYSWTIASASSGITGFDANEFSIYTTAVNGTNGFSNSFAGTFSMSQSGNNLNLNYDPTPVPEPANAVTVLALFSGAVLQRRKRVVRH